MVLKRAMNKQRRDMVLGIAVNEYIKTVTPVSSGHIVNEYELGLSPATIRNILAELEREGMLTHPHTSAGRIPTQEGYRYFVDNLMYEIQLLEEEKRRIKTDYLQDVKDLEILLDRTSQVISDVTQYTSIISIDNYNKIFCKGTSYIVEFPETQDTQKIKDILKALEEKERLLKFLNQKIDKNIEIYIGHEITLASMETCSLAVSSYRLSRGQTGRLAVLGPTRMNYPKVVSTLQYLRTVMSQL